MDWHTEQLLLRRAMRIQGMMIVTQLPSLEPADVDALLAEVSDLIEPAGDRGARRWSRQAERIVGSLPANVAHARMALREIRRLAHFAREGLLDANGPLAVTQIVGTAHLRIEGASPVDVNVPVPVASVEPANDDSGGNMRGGAGCA